MTLNDSHCVSLLLNHYPQPSLEAMDEGYAGAYDGTDHSAGRKNIAEIKC